MKYLAIMLVGSCILLSDAAEAKEYECSGVARNMTTNEVTSGELKTRVIDLGGSITVDFGRVIYTTSKIAPEKPEGKTYPSGATKEGNIIQRRGDGHYRFFQMSHGDVVDLICN
ncbi:TPA: hypothetical protein R1910_001335 [Klebsiella oxytoca]|uniref:hypothetical protein n=1 Tax=Citrobacter amalonaticus TaxID=35703 RepID=UPI001788637A|nr:hypothetical protein [Citrobacter amalonaticus]MBE0395423.1 hypothetical protein [Citrobacter amalonaticus]HEC2075165.1 hypothetical protein [Klebsiella oxytoca]